MRAPSPDEYPQKIYLHDERSRELLGQAVTFCINSLSKGLAHKTAAEISTSVRLVARRAQFVSPEDSQWSM
jgi:hypothetical protein